MNNLFLFSGDEPELRVRKNSRNSASSSDSATKVPVTKFHVIDPIGVLKAGLTTVRHHQFGWLAEDLKLSGECEATKEALNARMWSGATTIRNLFTCVLCEIFWGKTTTHYTY